MAASPSGCEPLSRESGVSPASPKRSYGVDGSCWPWKKPMKRLILCTAVLSLLASAAFAQAPTPNMPPAQPPKATTAKAMTTTTASASTAQKPRTAASRQCSKDADAKNIHGKPRKAFMSQCKRRGEELGGGRAYPPAPAPALRPAGVSALVGGGEVVRPAAPRLRHVVRDRLEREHQSHRSGRQQHLGGDPSSTHDLDHAPQLPS